jgi:hypothetical protein
MTENKKPQDEQEIELEVPQGAEVEIETPKPMEQKAKVQHETKDKRGGNHNPTGANQYTTGRNDDRGRKE